MGAGPPQIFISDMRTARWSASPCGKGYSSLISTYFAFRRLQVPFLVSPAGRGWERELLGKKQHSVAEHLLGMKKLQDPATD